MRKEESNQEEQKEFELQEVKIGTLSQDGDYRRVYRFRGAQVGFMRDHTSARSRDDRGTDKTLYQISEDRYIVLIENWSQWQGEVNTSSFYRWEDDEISIDTIEDVPMSILTTEQVCKRFPDLANAAGLMQPIELRFGYPDF